MSIAARGHDRLVDGSPPTNDGVQFSAPRTIGAESEKSAMISSPAIVRCTVIGTSQTSIPSESM